MLTSGARFNREVEVSNTLNHRNIVQLIDWGEEDKMLYLVMEIVDGDTLREETKEPMSEERFLELFRQISAGLEHAHQQGIVHRDLKPTNIMLTSKGIIKIMDLGLAKSASQAHKVTQTGDALGTPAYMPPEQISGGTLTPKSDQYALGIVAYEMLTGGRIPFEGDPEDPMKLIMQQLSEKPPPIREWRPSIPEALEKAINRMLEKDPNARFESMAKAFEALEEAIVTGDKFQTQVMTKALGVASRPTPVDRCEPRGSPAVFG